MEFRRVLFRSKRLPDLLLAQQIVITLVFFIWPALQAVKSSFEREDPFGFKTTFIWFENYRRILEDASYINSLEKTAIFAISVTALSMGLSLLLAVCVNRVMRSGRIYTTLLVWPYAVAPVVVAILWWFMFNPPIGLIPYLLRGFGKTGPA